MCGKAPAAIAAFLFFVCCLKGSLPHTIFSSSPCKWRPFIHRTAKSALAGWHDGVRAWLQKREAGMRAEEQHRRCQARPRYAMPCQTGPGRVPSPGYSSWRASPAAGVASFSTASICEAMALSCSWAPASGREVGLMSNRHGDAIMRGRSCDAGTHRCGSARQRCHPSGE